MVEKSWTEGKHVNNGRTETESNNKKQSVNIYFKWIKPNM